MYILLQVLVSPVLAGMAVAIGVPILLFYVYGVVPVSLCRSGAGVTFNYDDDDDDDENDLLGVLGARNTGKICD
jgi:E3 ubiquitin-protein ligase RNF19A